VWATRVAAFLSIDGAETSFADASSQDDVIGTTRLTNPDICAPDRGKGPPMTWIYRQTTGELVHDAKLVEAHGYSGHGRGKNNAAMQAERDIGPIPQGAYHIGFPHYSERVGPYAMELIPAEETDTFGRFAFFLHGDSATHPGEASDGCIVMSFVARLRVWKSADRMLTVVP
jgi:hypothetical protein